MCHRQRTDAATPDRLRPMVHSQSPNQCLSTPYHPSMDEIKLDRKRPIPHHYRQATKSHLAENRRNFWQKGHRRRSIIAGYGGVGRHAVFRDYSTIEGG